MRTGSWWHLRRPGRQMEIGMFDTTAHFITQCAPVDVASHAAHGTSGAEQSPELTHDSSRFTKTLSYHLGEGEGFQGNEKADERTLVFFSSYGSGLMVQVRRSLLRESEGET